MPTKPLESVLYRELSVVEARELIEVAAPLLRELVNYATNALIRCASSAKGEENENLAALFLYRHIIELTDATEVLVSACCGPAAVPLARSSFEGLLSLDYIMEDPALYVRRSLAWLASYVRGRLRFYRSLLPDELAGQRLLEAIDQDKMIRDFGLPPADKVQPAIQNLEHLLARDQFRTILDEYSGYRRDPNWYALFGGPQNLRELAEHLKRNAHYEVLYRQWSLAAHGQDFSPFIAASGDGDAGIRRIRDPAMLRDVALISCGFMLDATRLMLGYFRPGEDLARWYVREVRGRFMRLVSWPWP